MVSPYMDVVMNQPASNCCTCVGLYISVLVPSTLLVVCYRRHFSSPPQQSSSAVPPRCLVEGLNR